MEFEKIRVGVFSRSPLVARFLVIRQLSEEDYFQGIGLKRTEIASLSYPEVHLCVPFNSHRL